MTARAPRTIKRIYVRRYRDNGQVTAYVDWSDGSRTENTADRFRQWRKPSYVAFDFGEHMHALFNRAKREGLHLQLETWGA